MAIISIVARVQPYGDKAVKVKIFGASPNIATDIHNAFPGLQASKDLIAESAGRSQPTSVTLTGSTALKSQTIRGIPDPIEFYDGLLAEVTAYMNFLTRYKFSVVSVTRDPPAQNYQLTCTWTLQQPY